MTDVSLPLIFGRLGSKRRLLNKISKMFPEGFTTYVEPFVGGGTIMLGHKFKPGQKIVINDLDKTLISGWRALKTATGDIKKYDLKAPAGAMDSRVSGQPVPPRVARLQAIANSNPTNALGRLVKVMVRSRGTFGGGDAGSGKATIYKPINPYLSLKKLPEYKAKMKGVTILNQDYLSVINKYDRPGTFFYLDPPYQSSKEQQAYKETTSKTGNMDYNKMAERLRKLKGKFLLSLNDSASIRRIFKGFKIRGFTQAPQKLGGGGGPGSASRKEVLISNY